MSSDESLGATVASLDGLATVVAEQPFRVGRVVVIAISTIDPDDVDITREMV